LPKLVLPQIPFFISVVRIESHRSQAFLHLSLFSICWFFDLYKEPAGLALLPLGHGLGFLFQLWFCSGFIKEASFLLVL
jgi:hypothetical protein